MKALIARLKLSTHQPWYAPVLGFLAALDYFIAVIPTDGLLIASSMATPRRWLRLFLCLALGSALGATAFAAVIQTYGNPFMDWLFPNLHQHRIWILSEQWTRDYGLGAIGIISALPLITHPVIAIAALAGTPFQKIGFMVLLGRLLKYGIFSWVAAHAPKLLTRK